MRESNTYLTHDNGGRPFKVVINGRTVDIFLNDEYQNRPSQSLISSFISQETFVGESPRNDMTEFSGGFGENFKGNSILIKTNENEYVYIGERIFKFNSMSKIIEFVSPVGNSDVPYPYAKDEEGNYYLLIENVILLSKPDFENLIEEYGDPYSYYYKEHYITMVERSYNRPLSFHFDEIKKYYIGDDEYNLSYFPFPEKDYDRLTREGETMFVDLTDSSRKQLNKPEYIDLMGRFGIFKGYQPLIETEIIQERLY